MLEELQTIAAQYLDQEALEQGLEICENLEGQKHRLTASLAAYERKAEEYSRGIRQLYLDKVKGMISEKDYLDMAKDFSKERDRLQERIVQEKERLTQLEETMAREDRRQRLVEWYAKPDHLTRGMVEELIDSILVGKRIPGTRNVPIEIHWKF